MSATTRYADWIAVDWGTSNLRVWAMSAGGDVLAEKKSNTGMGSLTQDGFEPALLALTENWLGTTPNPVIACGMVGSRQGWAEAGYCATPCTPAGPPTIAPSHDPRLAVSILPGVKQASPPDVMRGEETQIAGFLAQRPDFDGVLCLPGTHTKWVRISAGEIVSFQTFMSGELFSVLTTHSVLRHSTTGTDLHRDAFAEAVGDTLSHPERLAARLFQIRAADLLDATGSAVARGRLSGTLLGVELAATRPYWLGQEVAIIGAKTLAELYATALSQQGVAASTHSADTLTLSGLKAAYAEMNS